MIRVKGIFLDTAHSFSYPPGLCAFSIEAGLGVYALQARQIRDRIPLRSSSYAGHVFRIYRIA